MKNEGYAIHKKELYNHSKKFGIAVATNGRNFVTWEYSILENGTYNFFWGHYFTTYHKAMKDYHKRLAEYYELRIEAEEEADEREEQ